MGAGCLKMSKPTIQQWKVGERTVSIDWLSLLEWGSGFLLFLDSVWTFAILSALPCCTRTNKNPAVKTADEAFTYVIHVQEAVVFLVLSAIRSGNHCCSDLLGVGVATVPQTIKTIPPLCTVPLMPDDKVILVESRLHFKIWSVLLHILSLPTAVHDTSKRLSQTLREVYEPEWNGVEDLAVITEVRQWCVFMNVCSNRELRAVPQRQIIWENQFNFHQFPHLSKQLKPITINTFLFFFNNNNC